jgi:group I intron endonuclease
MIIYKAENLVTGKIYIGQTKGSIESRSKKHIKGSSKPLLWKSAFLSSIRKHGGDNFVFSIVDTATTRKELDEKEKYWIAFYGCMVPNGYNMTAGGDGTVGYRFPEEVKKTRKCYMRGRKGPLHPGYGKKRPGHSARMSGEGNPNYGKVISEEQKEIIRKVQSARLTGDGNHMRSEKHRERMRKICMSSNPSSSPDAKRKISESKIGKYEGDKNSFYGKCHSEETRAKMRLAWELRKARTSGGPRQ